MKKKINSFVALFLFLFVANSLKSVAQEIPPNFLSEVPQAWEKLNSDDVRQRTSILSELIKPVERSCTLEVYLTYNLAKEDYIYIVRQILEKDLTALDEKAKPEIWSKLSYLISKYQMKEFAEPITAYLGEQMSVQAEIISVLRNLEAKEFDSKIAPLLNSPEKYIQRLVLETLISFRSKKAVPTLITMLTGDNKFSEPYWAMLKLVEIDGKEGSPQIAAILKDESPDMRYLAIDSLVKLNAKAQAKDIWQFLKSNTDKRLEGFAIVALLHLEQKEAIPLAINHFKKNIQGDENYFVWQFTNELQPKLLIPAFISIYNSKEKIFEDEVEEKKFRHIIFRALLNFKTPDAIPIYRQNLVEKSYSGGTWKPNNDVARVLLELNATETLDDLISLFNDSLKPSAGSDTNYAAGELGTILARFDDKKVWKLLVDYVEKSNYYQRDLIIVGLNKQIDKKLWTEIQIKTPPQIPYNSVKYIAEISSRETGIPISFEYIPKKDTIRCQPLDSGDKEGMPCEYIDGKISLSNTIDKIVYSLNYDKRGKYTYIFDKGTIRILSVEKAVEWWRNNILK